MKTLLVTDWSDWEQVGFDQAATRCDIRVNVRRQRFTPSRRLCRYAACAFEAVGAVSAMRCSDAVIAWQQVVGVAIAVLASEHVLRRCPLTIAGFIQSEAGGGLLRAARVWAVSRAMRRAAAVVCFSSAEAEALRSMYPDAASRIHFVRLGLDLPAAGVASEPCGEPFVLAAGTSNRDYGTLLSVASDIPVTVRVYAPPELLSSFQQPPPNVEIVESFTWESYFRDISRARVVAIPIDDAGKTSGQLVALHAMHSGRAIVATRSAGLDDYLSDKVNALLVPSHNAPAFAEALRLVMTDDVASARLGEAAAVEAHAQLSAGVFWGRMFEVVGSTTSDWDSS